ncbi:SapC family protein [Methylobacterium sp. E-016]|uniref:SapC family protein n=1 Tax=Methylobacterium sp. E-016 TaxID=2836556 RepID=UPI001FBAB470|nr:SapC family protein [Methylobacterium sp. E-016]MCJ2074447.1 SapC family protein [Methylobacterium sp. E-016]
MSMYQSVQALQQGAEHLLFDLADYDSLAETIYVPIAVVEAQTLAHHYPLVWRRAGETFELVALLSISAPHYLMWRQELKLGLPHPLLIEAYPLCAAFNAEGAERGAVLFDAVAPVEGAKGTPVFKADRTISSAAAQRLNALQVYASDLARTQAFTKALAGQGLLLDWPVRLLVGSDGVELDGFCVLDPAAAARKTLSVLVADHGFSIAELATFHDLSLFNMQRLVDRHRSERLLAQAGRAETARAQTAPTLGQTTDGAPIL